MTRHPDLLAGLREMAPKWARWLCISSIGYWYWQNSRGEGLEWYQFNDGAKCAAFCRNRKYPKLFLSAIHLPTGTIHLQQPDGSVIEVTRAEWDV